MPRVEEAKRRPVTCLPEAAQVDPARGGARAVCPMDMSARKTSWCCRPTDIGATSRKKRLSLRQPPPKGSRSPAPPACGLISFTVRRSVHRALAGGRARRASPAVQSLPFMPPVYIFCRRLDGCSSSFCFCRPSWRGRGRRRACPTIRIIYMYASAARSVRFLKGDPRIVNIPIIYAPRRLPARCYLQTCICITYTVYGIVVIGVRCKGGAPPRPDW